MKVCQIILLVIFILAFCFHLYEALGGTPPRPAPTGAWGIYETIVNGMLWLTLLWACGAFSRLL